MKHRVFLLALICLAGCSGSDPAGPPADVSTATDPVAGQWTGTSRAEYPGPDDSPVVEEVDIRFSLAEGRFSYSLVPPTLPEDIEIPPPPEISGIYVVGDGWITLYGDMALGMPAAMRLVGTFGYELEDGRLILDQTLHPESWPETHRVTLEPILPPATNGD